MKSPPSALIVRRGWRTGTDFTAKCFKMSASRMSGGETVRNFWRVGAVAVVSMIAIGAALAPDRALAADPDYFAVGAGVYDVERPGRVAQLRLEYRFSERFLIFKPMIGVLGTNEKTFIGYAGLRTDLYFGRHLVVTPNAAFAAFDRGDGKKLGSALEFKSGVEIDYRMNDHTRIGVAFDHISNAGLTQANPGSDSWVLYYAIPIGWFTGPH